MFIWEREENQTAPTSSRVLLFGFMYHWLRRPRESQKVIDDYGAPFGQLSCRELYSFVGLLSSWMHCFLHFLSLSTSLLENTFRYVPSVLFLLILVPRMRLGFASRDDSQFSSVTQGEVRFRSSSRTHPWTFVFKLVGGQTTGTHISAGLKPNIALQNTMSYSCRTEQSTQRTGTLANQWGRDRG